MKEDQDMLNAALDAAELKLSETAEVSEPIEAPELEEVADPVEQAEEVKLVTKSQEQKARDPKGKFTSHKASQNQPTDAEQATEQDSDQEAKGEVQPEVTEATEPTEAQDVNPPPFWTAEHKALFGKAPSELKKVIAQYDLAAQQRISRLANEAKRAETYEKRFYEDMEPNEVQTHKAKLSLQGINDPVSELHRYRAWNRVFESDARQGISDLMYKNGLTPYDFLQDNGQPIQPQSDPRVDEAVRAAEEAKQQLKAFQDQQTQAEEQRMIATINSFKQGKDSSGQVREQFASMYAPQIDQRFQSLLQNNPYLDFGSALTQAYEEVKAEVNKLHGVSKAPVSKPREQVIAESKKAQAAAASMTGAPNAGMSAQRPKLKGKNFSEKLDSALDIAFDRAGA